MVVAAAGGGALIATQAPPGAMLAGFRAAFAWTTFLSLGALLVWLSGLRDGHQSDGEMGEGAKSS